VVRAATPARDGEVTLAFEIEPVRFDADRIVPLGLIVAELTMNAMKYAFRDIAKGTLRYTLRSTGDTYVLSVADNGPGFDQAAEAKRADSLGIQLIEALARQLQGAVSRSNEEGAVVRVEFPATP
jgi:two-component sensor histidine kinase